MSHLHRKVNAPEGLKHTGLSPLLPVSGSAPQTSRPAGCTRELGVPQQQEHKAGSAQGLKNQPGGAREQQGRMGEQSGRLSLGEQEPAGRGREEQRLRLRGVAPQQDANAGQAGLRCSL